MVRNTKEKGSSSNLFKPGRGEYSYHYRGSRLVKAYYERVAAEVEEKLKKKADDDVDVPFYED